MVVHLVHFEAMYTILSDIEAIYTRLVNRKTKQIKMPGVKNYNNKNRIEINSILHGNCWTLSQFEFIVYI